VGLGIARTDAKLRKTVPGAIKGQRVLNVPDWQASVSFDYSQPISSPWRFISRGGLQFIGESAADFEAYAEGPARGEHDRIIAEAEAQGVFGVPTMVFNGELFWGGDRIPLLIERIRAPETADIALGRKRAGSQAADRPS
jgi:hypothetical protein